MFYFCPIQIFGGLYPTCSQKEVGRIPLALQENTPPVVSRMVYRVSIFLQPFASRSISLFSPRQNLRYSFSKPIHSCLPSRSSYCISILCISYFHKYDTFCYSVPYEQTGTISKKTVSIASQRIPLPTVQSSSEGWVEEVSSPLLDNTCLQNIPSYGDLEVFLALLQYKYLLVFLAILQYEYLALLLQYKTRSFFPCVHSSS